MFFFPDGSVLFQNNNASDHTSLISESQDLNPVKTKLFLADLLDRVLINIKEWNKLLRNYKESVSLMYFYQVFYLVTFCVKAQ